MLQSSTTKREFASISSKTPLRRNDLEHVFHFIYKTKLENGLVEHELDHVFNGYYGKSPKINLSEVADWKYMPLDEIKRDIWLNPHHYTVWFKIIFARYLNTSEAGSGSRGSMVKIC